MKISTRKLDEAGRKVVDLGNAVADEIASDANGEVVDVAGDSKKEAVNEIETNLDSALRKAKNGVVKNLLITGQAGTGKTQIVKAWAKKNNIHLVELETAPMEPSDAGGAQVPDLKSMTAIKLSPVMFDELDNIPNSVLFLDEINRGVPEVRAQLLKLIDEHRVTDYRQPGLKRKLKNFLFTVACQNPSTGGYVVYPLDFAEKRRFKEIKFSGNTKSWLEWFKGYTQEKIDRDPSDKEWVTLCKRQYALAAALVKYPKFKFNNDMDIQQALEKDGDEAKVTQPASLTALLDSLDFGTKEELIREWDTICNHNDIPMVEAALANYKEVDDKANQALDKYADVEDAESAFSQEPAKGQGQAMARLNKNRAAKGLPPLQKKN